MYKKIPGFSMEVDEISLPNRDTLLCHGDTLKSARDANPITIKNFNKNFCCRLFTVTCYLWEASCLDDSIIKIRVLDAEKWVIGSLDN